MEGEGGRGEDGCEDGESGGVRMDVRGEGGGGRMDVRMGREGE